MDGAGRCWRAGQAELAGAVGRGADAGRTTIQQAREKWAGAGGSEKVGRRAERAAKWAKPRREGKEGQAGSWVWAENEEKKVFQN